LNALALTLEESAVYDEKSLCPEAYARGGNLGEFLAIDISCCGDFNTDGVVIKGHDEVYFAAVIDSKVCNITVVVPNSAKVTIHDGFENPSLQLGIFRRLRCEGE
jgi:hypothetical protein